MVDSQGQVVEKDSFVPFEQEPIFDLPDDTLFDLSLFVFVGDGLVHVFIFVLVALLISFDSRGVVHFQLLVIVELNFLQDFLVLEVDLVHLCGHLELVLGHSLGDPHGLFDVVLLHLLGLEQVQVENLFPGDSVLGVVLQHPL